MAEFHVDTSTVLRKRGLPVGSSNETNLSKSERRDEATGEEKVDHLSLEVTGLNSEIVLQHCSSSTDCLTELNDKVLYLDSQKVEILTKENLELTKKLDEANEKMKGMVVIPKWAELNVDCLVNILGRLDMEMLLLDIPYVCKSWYKATCDPQCWSTLNFVKTTPLYGDRLWSLPQRLTSEIAKDRPLYDSTITSFIKNVVKRSNGLATFVKLPSCCTQEAIVFISNECPNLETLKLPSYCYHDIETLLPSLVSKWKRLENLHLSWSEIKNTGQILPQIRTHCKSFGALEIFKGKIRKDDASSIVTYLPNMKGLSLSNLSIEKVNLLTILNGCKGLEYLDARYCVGFDEEDVDILRSAAHIHSVRLDGSMLYDDYGAIFSDDDYGIED